MKFVCFRYDRSCNLGDEIQSLATEQFLHRIDTRIDRDNLGCFSNSEKCLVIMNGWFSYHAANCFPPSDSLVPVFIGFHITDVNGTAKRFLNPECVEYLKRNEPIGCRDKGTAKLLGAKGIRSFYSKCLTITFPKRKLEPKGGKVFLVDAGHIPIAEFLHKQAISISHITYDTFGHEIKMLMAKRLLATYRNEARLVITTRLHCALPCVAMGVPVIFFGNSNDYRVSVLSDLNIAINRLPNEWVRILYRIITSRKVVGNRFWGKIFRKIAVRLLYGNVNWNPQSVCIEKEKQVLKTMTKDLLGNKMGAWNGVGPK